MHTAWARITGQVPFYELCNVYLSSFGLTWEKLIDQDYNQTTFTDIKSVATSLNQLQNSC